MVRSGCDHHGYTLVFPFDQPIQCLIKAFLFLYISCGLALQSHITTSFLLTFNLHVHNSDVFVNWKAVGFGCVNLGGFNLVVTYILGSCISKC